jgi:hypothetical protein
MAEEANPKVAENIPIRTASWHVNMQRLFHHRLFMALLSFTISLQ